ncbi:LysR family transcriptional regulator [Streptomyces mirabilis]|uniref:LysR family transcriptional regulator n=1 Tax=Streptomyces mirabilis TaxID=68239 RepID=UPI0036CA8C73
MDLDLRVVRYVVCVGEELHFGRAADRLHITQQTLSAQVSRLERQLGVRLFLRDHRHVELTPAGEFFVQRGRRLLANADRMLAEVTGAAPAVRVDMVTEGLPLSALVARLRLGLPRTAFEFTQSHGLGAAVPQLLAGELDVAFGWVGGLDGPFPVPLEHRVVRRERLGLVMPGDHPLASVDEVPLEQLAAYPLLVHTAKEASEWERWNEALAAEFGLRVAERLHGHGPASANAAVLAYGHPSVVALEGPVPGGLVLRPLVAPVPVYEWSMVWLSTNRTTQIRQVLALITEISDAFGWTVPPSAARWAPAGRHRPPVPH